MLEKIYQFDSLIVDAAKHEVREIGEDGKEQVLPTPRNQIFAALVYLIENRHRSVSLAELYLASTPGKSAEDFDDQSGHKIIQECRRCLGDSGFRYIRKAGTRHFRFIHEDVKETSIQAKQTTGNTTVPHELESAVAAWTKIDSDDLYDAVVQYYRGKGVPMLSYQSVNGAVTTVPIYLRDSWQSLNANSLKMEFIDTDRPVQLSNEQKGFREVYPEIRAQLGLSGGWSEWNDPIFRLVKIQQRGSTLVLRFERGWFLDAHACQYLLEHEARLAILKRQGRNILSGWVPIRESMASTSGQIERFCEADAVVRIGVSNLILLRINEHSYRALIRPRGALSMDNSGKFNKFDAMSSGIFDIATAQPETADFSLEYKVFKEIYEELFAGAEVQKEIRKIDPYFFYKIPGLSEIKEMLNNGTASFHVTGLCIDLVRIVPELTTVLVVTDPSYYAMYEKRMEANAEHGAAIHFEVPRDISDVERYFLTEFPRVPGRPSEGRGFDPASWTLTGAFCFQQGIKKAVREHLL